MSHFRHLVAAAVLSALGLSVAAQDKSAQSVVQLPSAGGTVTTEEGSLSLSNNTGSANFRLPFPELLQRGRFGAPLMLSYNQFAGDSGSGLGIGWTFSVPSISVNDDLGTAIPGTRPEGDFFSQLTFNGARLVFLGEDGGLWRYRAEYSEQAVEILYHPQPFEVLTLGPEGEDVVETVASGFEVRNPDGTRMIFSGDPAVAEGSFDIAAPYVTRWPLVMQLNPDRDVVHYSYVREGGRSYLSQVSFAGGQSTYDFELIETRGSLVSHVTGARQQNARLYGKMVARFRDTIYGQWCFGYVGRALDDNTGFTIRTHDDCLEMAQADLQPLIDENSVNVLDQLRIVYRYGDTGGAPLTEETDALPTIAFDYSSWTAADLADRNLAFEAPNLAWVGDVPPWTLELADLNMDSLVDVVRTTDDGAEIFLGEGSLDSSFSLSAPLELSRPTEAGLQRVVAPRLVDDRYHFADILGDSYVDVVEVGDGVMHVFDGQADGTFPYLGRSISLPVSPTMFADGNGRFQDLNMDGRSDIVTTRLNADGRTEWVILLNLTRRQEDGGHLVNFGSLAKPFPFDSQDGQILGRPSTRLTDVNGDRLPDLIVIRPAEQGFCVYENRGNLFDPDPETLLFGNPDLADPRCGAGRFAAISGMLPSDNLRNMWYVDVNGDGIMDFASMGARTDELRVWLGFGDGTFLEEPLDLALNMRVQVGGSDTNFRSRVADLDADGQSEIIVFQTPSGTDVRPVVVIDFNRTQTLQLVKANLLTSVDFDSGRRHDIRYATSTDEMLRDRALGRPVRSLHFPVVVAKQMVTSEGLPGQPRADVQTEEYFYHLPFYDVINRRFIGFSQIEKVTYGDEFAAGRTTQTSRIDFEQYYAFADLAADLHLAGKLKARMTYEVVPDAVLLASAAETSVLDPAAAALHSLSTKTRIEQVPEPGRMLRCESMTWIAADRGDGTNFLRRTDARLSEAVGPSQVQPPSDEVCLAPTKLQTYADFDAFNLHTVETVTVRELDGPLDLAVPGFSRTTTLDYEQSRETLAALGIVNAVSDRRVLSGARLLSRESFTYRPENGGRMGTRTLEVFSGLGRVPEPLETLFAPTRALTRSMAYDVFGNIVEMADDLGVIEAVTFDPTGVLPLRHTRFSGQPGTDQVTMMTYDGEHEGLPDTQVTPLGLTIGYEYDELGRRIAERGSDGAEMLFSYRIGKAGLPSLILTSKRRYPANEAVPADETEWVDQLAAFNSRGNQIAEMENVAEGGVRVFNFSIFNRNEEQIFRWTPFTTTELPGGAALDVRAVFEMGDIPRPETQIGNAYTYDGLGRMIRETHPSGKVSELSYPGWGTRRITTYEDQWDGSVTSEEWRLGNENGIVGLVVSDGADTHHITRFMRDNFGYLSEIWLPGEVEPRRFVFNSIGDMERQSIPGMGDYYAFYDERGRRSHQARIAPDGAVQQLAYAYDFLNRKVAESADGTPRVAITYDEGVTLAVAHPTEDPLAQPMGKISRIDTFDPNGLFDATQRFGWDANGRLIQHEVEIAGETYAETFHRTLDARINRSTGPRGLSSDFALGPDENLRSVTIMHDSFGTETVIEEIAYNAEGRIDRIDYREDAVTEMAYDPATLFLERIASIAGDVPLQDLRMTFNGNGSITQIVDALAELDPGFGHVDRSGNFAYDFKNQLVSYQRYDETSAFDYTEAGTFERNDEFAAEAVLIPAAAAQTALLPSGTEEASYAFDGFGQLVSSPRVTGTVFDAYGRLIRAQTGTHDVFYGYDQTGRRLYKQVVPIEAPDDAELSLFPVESFEVGPRGEVSYVNIGSARLVRLEHDTGRWFYYLKDHLDSSDYLIASDGTPVEQMLYRAYGTEHEPERLSSAWGEHVQQVSASLPQERTHHRFTGKYLDDDTGLYYYGARYYDPALGRFISPDPLYIADPERCTTNPIACNLFAYANNNPMSFIDPTGLDGVVAGDEAYRRQIEESLQRIDPTARVDRETGEISQSWLHGLWLDIVDFFVPGSGYDTGRELVSQVIASEQTTTIQFSANDASVMGADPTVDWTTTPGDAVISYDPTFTPSLAEFDTSTGTVSMQAPDPGVILGHEIIHATHVMAGQVSGTNPVSYTGLDGSVRVAVDEEARTVGVGGTARPDDITENDLREMMGLNPRNHY